MHNIIIIVLNIKFYWEKKAVSYDNIIIILYIAGRSRQDPLHSLGAFLTFISRQRYILK